jgi:stress-induced morphogen
MYDYSYVLGLLRANAADLERRALSGEKTKLARMATERTLRNRALVITHRLQGMDELQRHQFVAEAVRRI